MPNPSLLLLVAAVTTLGPLEAQDCKPATADTGWTLYKSVATGPNTGVSSPNWPSIKGSTERFAGKFRFTVVKTSPLQADSARAGVLELWSGPRRENTRWTMQGVSDIDFEQWGIPGAVYSASSRDPQKPGVVLERNDQGRVLLVIAGADLDDAGVIFAVFRADASGFVGMWESGAPVIPSSKGYFCARR